LPTPPGWRIATTTQSNGAANSKNCTPCNCLRLTPDGEGTSANRVARVVGFDHGKKSQGCRGEAPSRSRSAQPAGPGGGAAGGRSRTGGAASAAGSPPPRSPRRRRARVTSRGEARPAGTIFGYLSDNGQLSRSTIDRWLLEAGFAEQREGELVATPAWPRGGWFARVPLAQLGPGVGPDAAEPGAAEDMPGFVFAATALARSCARASCGARRSRRPAEPCRSSGDAPRWSPLGLALGETPQLLELLGAEPERPRDLTHLRLPQSLRLLRRPLRRCTLRRCTPPLRAWTFTLAALRVDPSTTDIGRLPDVLHSKSVAGLRPAPRFYSPDSSTFSKRGTGPPVRSAIQSANAAG
jgi:hypothetical protein